MSDLKRALLALYALVLVLVAATPARAAGASIGDGLRASARGQPVYVTAGSGGIVAHSLDGSVERILVAGPVGAATLDAVWELVWYVKDGSLLVIDLREPYVRPMVIATGLPPGHGFRIQTDDDQVMQGGDGLILVQMTDRPAVDVWDSAIPYDETDPRARQKFEQVRASAARAKLVGGDWLAENATRRDRDSANGNLVEFKARPERVHVPGGCASADDPRCGLAADLGRTPLWLVLDGEACDAFGCVPLCYVYDPRSRMFSDPARLSFKRRPDGRDRSFCNLELSADQKAWYAGRHVCSAHGAPSCRRNPDPAIGWLDRGDQISLPSIRAY
jgi:hypothetical protein